MAKIHGTNGNDLLAGTADVDEMLGFDGHDVLFGSYGGDAMYGNLGYDTVDYTFSETGVSVSLSSNRGFGGMAEGDSYYLIEGMAGSLHNDTFVGNNEYNEAEGREGNDYLDGGGNDDKLDGGVGHDILLGGSSNDWLIGGTGDDALSGGEGRDFMEGGEGSDTVDYATSPGSVIVDLERHLAIGGDATGDSFLSIENFAGSAHDDTLMGNAVANVIRGRHGKDWLEGRGGDDLLLGENGNDVLNGDGGNDTMVGGLGDDHYQVNDAGDVVTEYAGEGTGDRVFASTSYTLTAGAEIEIFSTTLHAGTEAINLTGNELANVIYGNAGANTLDGRAGADTLAGLGGDDFFFVDNAGDVVIDGAGQGTGDRVFASTSYALAAGAQIEIFSTTLHAGTDAINLTGNELTNVIYGNAGANTLDGKAGADTLVGLGGDDFFFVDNLRDVVIDRAGEGSGDRVFASTSYTLTAGAQIEIFSTSYHAGTDAIDLIGNELGNVIYGNAGANLLFGAGGNDTLVGLGGADSFVFNAALDRLNNVDHIADFSPIDDQFMLHGDIFGALPQGTLAPDAFRIGTGAADATDRIIYNSAAGALFYDSDGTGSAAALQFAAVTPGLALTNGDFSVYLV